MAPARSQAGRARCPLGSAQDERADQGRAVAAVEAVQVLSTDGFVWAARAGWRPLPIKGFDRFGDGEGEMRWLLGGRVPFVRAAGLDVSRSDAGRLAIEATIWLPAAATGLDWRIGDDPDMAVARWRIGNEQPAVELHLDGEGRSRMVTMQRWGNPEPGTLRLLPVRGAAGAGDGRGRADHSNHDPGRLVARHQPMGTGRVLPRPHHRCGLPLMCSSTLEGCDERIRREVHGCPRPGRTGI